MDIEQIKTLTDLMVANDLTEIIIRDGENRIVLRRGAGVVTPQYAVAPIPTIAQPLSAPSAVPAAPPPAAGPPPTATADEPGGKIKSPMVGTFYGSPDPESPPFVKIGDKITPDSVVCIIEAMKVFNEIKADVSGTIASVELTSGKPVEFGQVLFKVRTE